jgi:NADPH-dependent 7-cyano-7-deazaguanine reductase QueF
MEQSSGTVLVNTVDENKSRYTNRDYQRALIARKIQNTVRRPLTRNFMNIVKQNLLKNCPITSTEDIMAAEDIFGPNLGSLKGKMARRGGKHVAID